MAILAKESPGHAVQVVLDGETVPVPPQAENSLRDLFSYLEQLAIRKERVLTSVRVDGAQLQSPGLKPAWEHFHQVEASTVSFAELGRHVLQVAGDQVKHLLRRVETIHTLVLINDWSVAQRLWLELVPDFKTPMLELSFLQELWGARMSEFKVGAQTLAEHWDRIGHIQAQLELILHRQGNMIEFSDVIEQRLLPWLRELALSLDRLDEEIAG